jgi:hypothetical protein
MLLTMWPHPVAAQAASGAREEDGPTRQRVWVPKPSDSRLAWWRELGRRGGMETAQVEANHFFLFVFIS